MNEYIEPPSFKYRAKDPANRHFGMIEAGKQVVHWIEDLGIFFHSLGYTDEMRKKGLLPDEFLWKIYLSDDAKNNYACYQLHLIEYLNRYSMRFRNAYQDYLEEWIDLYAEAALGDEHECRICKLKCSEHGVGH